MLLAQSDGAVADNDDEHGLVPTISGVGVTRLRRGGGTGKASA